MSFYIFDKNMDVVAEESTLQEAEKAFKEGRFGSGDYTIMQVVREVTLEPVPETFKVSMTATRTRAPRKPGKGKGKSKGKGEAPTEPQLN